MATKVKQQIADTMLRLAMKYGIDKVTVNAIVSECGISRQAFYYYYRDIVDVAQYVLEDFLQKVLREGEQTEDPKEGFWIFAEQFVDRLPVVSLTVHSKLRTEIEQILVRSLTEYFRTVFFRQECGRGLSQQQIDFHSDFLACGMTAFAVEHCNDREFDKEQFIQSLWDLVERTYGAPERKQ